MDRVEVFLAAVEPLVQNFLAGHDYFISWVIQNMQLFVVTPLNGLVSFDLQSIFDQCTKHALAFVRDSGKMIVAYYIVSLLAVTFMHPAFAGGKNKGKKMPAVQGGWPFFGQVFTMVKGSPWDTMANWSDEYGGIFTFSLFGKSSICVSDPALLTEILQTKLNNFKKDKQWTYKPFLEILGNGLVTAEGKEWRKQRLLLSNYLRIEILDQIPEMAFEAVQRLMEKLEKVKKEGGTIEMAEEFRGLTLQVISEALLSLSPEESDSTFANMYLPIVEEGNLRTWAPQRMYNILAPSWWAHKRAVKRLDDYVTSLIQKRWNLRQLEQEKEKEKSKGAIDNGDSGRRPDVLDKILGAVNAAEYNGPGGAAIVRQIRDEIKTFVLAGHETSASMLAWTLYELHRSENTTQLASCLTESERVYEGHMDTRKYVKSMPDRQVLAGRGNTGRSPNGASSSSTGTGASDSASANTSSNNGAGGDIDSNSSNSNSSSALKSSAELVKEQQAHRGGLDYMECCLRESLRKYSVVPTVVRTCEDPMYIGEGSDKYGKIIKNSKTPPYFFPGNQTVMLNIQGVHHDEKLWPQPKIYRPERFLPLEQGGQEIKPFSFVPFVEGPRMCLGQFLSLLESKCVLSCLLRRYRFELTNPMTAGDKHSFMVPIVPAEGHIFKIHDR